MHSLPEQQHQRWSAFSSVALVLVLGAIGAATDAADCNLNGIEDAADIAAETSADCNQDGVPDECERAPIELEASATAFPIPGIPDHVTTTDLNGDGRPDLVSVHRTSVLGVLLGGGEGEFAEVQVIKLPTRPRRVATGDFDGDGDIDLATANSDHVLTLLNDGAAQFQLQARIEVPTSTRFITTLDVGDRGVASLILVNGARDVVLLIENNGAGEWAAPREIATGEQPRHAAAADVDGDGRQDLVVAFSGEGTVAVLRNQGDGTFTRTGNIPGGDGPFIVAAVQSNKDGAVDLAVLARDGVTVWQNDGAGSFEDPWAYPGSVFAMATGDFDGDALDEVLLSFEGTNTVQVLRPSGGGPFEVAPPIAVRFRRHGLSVADFDGDGDTDVGLWGAGREEIGFLWNAEHGRSGLVLRHIALDVEARPHGIGAGDVNGDGIPDIVSSNGHFDTLSVMISRGDGSFERHVDYRLAGAGHYNDVEVIDIDKDGDADLVAADQDAGRITTFPNRGDGTFGRPVSVGTSNRPWTLSSDDFDRDGWVDIVAANVGAGVVSVHFNDGKGGLVSRQAIRTGGAPVAVDTGDVDGDGFPDVVVGNRDSQDVVVLRYIGDRDFTALQRMPRASPVTGITLADLDRDGALDLATANGASITVARNRGAGTFLEPEVIEVPFETYTMTNADINRDQRPDLVTSNRTTNGVAVFFSNGDGTLSWGPQYVVGLEPSGVVAADFDADGDVDLATADRSAQAMSVLFNHLTGAEFELDFVELICTPRNYTDVSVRSRAPEIERVGKYILPARQEPELLGTVFQNSARFPLHQQFLATVFPDRFPGLTVDEYNRLVARRASRSYFAGSVRRFRWHTPDGTSQLAYGFSVAADEALLQEEAEYVYDVLRKSFHLEPLGYLPDSSLEREAAASWKSTSFPIFDVGGSTGLDYEAYTQAVGYGRVRILDEEQFTAANETGQVSFQNILVLARAPRDIEGVVGGVVTAEEQGQLSHLAVRTARRNVPNAFVAGAAQVFQEFEGKLVRLEVAAGGYGVREATVEEATMFWEENQPTLSEEPSLDPEFLGLARLSQIATLDAHEPNVSQESRFGGKATNLARLGRVLEESPFAELRESGFAIPVRYYFEFLRANRMPSAFDFERMVTYEEYLDELLTSDLFQSDSEFRFEALAQFRFLARATGTVDPDLVAAVAARIENVFGSTRRAVRFRSSSNVEDLLEFNGAGLYESTGGCVLDGLDDDDDGPSLCDARPEERTIERALKKVWTSLWTFRAYEERAFFGIPSDLAGMAVLVSRSFPDERANGVAFTGNISNPLDKSYVIISQLGEESVVSPDPGVLPEKDVLEVRDGEVVRIVRPPQGSTLLPEGVWILSDAQLIELGRFMAFVSERFPLNLGPYRRDQVLLDMEFKVERKDGSLAVKQVRPFLLTTPAPPAPEFGLDIPPGLVACSGFAFAGAGRGPREEYELKSQVRFVGGEHALPTNSESFTLDLIEEVTLGPDRQVLRPVERGLMRVVRVAVSPEVTRYRFTFEQEFRQANGDPVRLTLALPDFVGRGDVAEDPILRLTSQVLSRNLGEEILVGWMSDTTGEGGEEPRIRYGTCDASVWERWEVVADLAGGNRVQLEERFAPAEDLSKTAPASVAWAEVTLDGTTHRVADYWRLVYSAFRHNTGIRYWVVFREPVTVAGIAAPVRAIELVAPDELLGHEPAVRYLGDDFEELRLAAVTSFARRSRPDASSPPFRRGDTDGSDSLNMTDALRILGHLFAGGVVPVCQKGADVDDDGRVNVADGIFLLNHLFNSGPSPAAPFTDCGEDPTEDALSCGSYLPCGGR